MNPDALQQALLEQLCDCGTDYEALAARLPYVPTPPPDTLLDYAQVAHNSKPYRREGNSADLTIEELFSSIKWISIQEDINYPMPRYQGRKMPYTRYIEVVHIAKHKDSQHSLGEVIQRAISHTRPSPWGEMNALDVATSAIAGHAAQ